MRGRTHVSHHGRECVKVSAKGPWCLKLGSVCVCVGGGPCGERVYVSKCVRVSRMQV